MERTNLYQKAIDAEIDRLEKVISDSKKEIENLKLKKIDERKKLFKMHYGESCKKVFSKYVKRYESCCGQGGTGYACWISQNYSEISIAVDNSIHGKSWMSVDKNSIGVGNLKDYCHKVVLGLKNSVPSQKEKDACFAIFGADMKITTKEHREVWGN